MSDKSIRANVSPRLPAKQLLVMEQKVKLKRLVAEFPDISFYLDSNELKDYATNLFGKTGFICNHIDVKGINNLVKRLAHALENGHLILIHYKEKPDGSNILNIFNALRRYRPYKSFKNIIPIFVAKVVHGKCNMILRMLSKFDIVFAIFLSPESSGDAKLEKLFNELQTFQKLVFDEISLESTKKPDVTQANEKKTENIEKYNELIKEADGLMDENSEKAIELFTEAIALKPECGAYVKRGDAYYIMDEFMPAINDYRKALILKKGSADPYAKISKCCFKLVKKEAAGKNANKAKEWYNRGIKAFNKAEVIVKEIEGDEELFVEGAPKFIYKNLMAALTEADFRGIGMNEEEKTINSLAKNVFEKIKHEEYLYADFLKDGVDIDARIDYAILLTRQRQYKAAEQIFRTLIRQDKDNAGPAFNNFAVELRKNGEYEKAFKIYTELLEYKIPDRDIVIQNMIKAGRECANAPRIASNSQKRIRIYEAIIKHAHGARNLEWVLCDIAVLYLILKDTEQALVYFNMAVKTNKDLIESELFEAYKPLHGFVN